MCVLGHFSGSVQLFATPGPSLPGSVHGSHQARILEWSCTLQRIFPAQESAHLSHLLRWHVGSSPQATWEAPGKLSYDDQNQIRVLPGGLAVRTLCFYCQDQGFNPRSGKWDPISCTVWTNKQTKSDRRFSLVEGLTGSGLREVSIVIKMSYLGPSHLFSSMPHVEVKQIDFLSPCIQSCVLGSCHSSSWNAVLSHCVQVQIALSSGPS